MPEHLPLGEADGGGGADASVLVAEADADQPAAGGELVERLLEGHLQADGVERDIEAAATGDVPDGIRQPVVAGVERVVGPQFQGRFRGPPGSGRPR